MPALLAWMAKNRVLIAALSVLGSLAGLGFATTDLHAALEEKKKARPLEEKLKAKKV